MFKLPEVSRLEGLQHREINIADNQVLNQLSDLTSFIFLREINARCPSLLEFSRLNCMSYLKRVEFSGCDEVKEPLDCRDCVELQSIVINSCFRMIASLLLVGCMKVSKSVLWECDAFTTGVDVHVPSILKTLELFVSSEAASVPRSLESCDGLQILKLCNMVELKELPSFRFLSNLTVLQLEKCGIRELPDLTCYEMLDDVCLSTVKNLQRFPDFSQLMKLKKLVLYNCWNVKDPPDISTCNELKAMV